ncbi:FMN-dependent NADH-azoreductase [Novosphingobium terrae]|uniref:FMN-dependent NADH-azoreductase n=1 Tax=Novosphingobium terrae TaxID=2726189 RepID=UPI001981D599|nr:NAD(P)H-dependent oxidoreductase [Novosphingobium terrae]
MKLLHLDSSITGDNSASRTITAAIVERLSDTHPGLEITHRDLAAEPLSHLTMETFLALENGEDVQQFLDADIVVIGAGFYNFTIPSQLKAWIDRIAVRGKTFSYGENGPKGLAGGKRVIIALARGNVYGEDSPYKAYEHAETLLRSIFGFIGVTDLEVIIAEGLGRGEEARKASIEGALEKVSRLEAADASA